MATNKKKKTNENNGYVGKIKYKNINLGLYEKFIYFPLNIFYCVPNGRNLKP